MVLLAIVDVLFIHVSSSVGNGNHFFMHFKLVIAREGAVICYIYVLYIYVIKANRKNIVSPLIQRGYIMH